MKAKAKAKVKNIYRALGCTFKENCDHKLQQVVCSLHWKA